MSSLVKDISKNTVYSNQLLSANRMLLQGVSWQTYESLLEDFASKSCPHLTYDEGILEIMSPTSEHERVKHVIEMIVELLSLEIGLDVYCLASTTFKSKDLKRGFEPDTCFYIQNLTSIEGKESIDLEVDPPPDLIIEIDITSQSINKFPIYASLNMPEIWRYDGENLIIYQLSNGAYIEVISSVALPQITSSDISDFIKKNVNKRSTALAKEIKDWAKRITIL